jgi:hypothetical protein
VRKTRRADSKKNQIISAGIGDARVSHYLLCHNLGHHDKRFHLLHERLSGRAEMILSEEPPGTYATLRSFTLKIITP